MAITLVQAQAKLVLWMAADDAITKGESYSIGNRSLTRVDADQIRKNIIFWENKINAINRGGSSMNSKRAVPRDL